MTPYSTTHLLFYMLHGLALAPSQLDPCKTHIRYKYTYQQKVIAFVGRYAKRQAPGRKSPCGDKYGQT